MHFSSRSSTHPIWPLHLLGRVNPAWRNITHWNTDWCGSKLHNTGGTLPSNSWGGLSVSSWRVSCLHYFFWSDKCVLNKHFSNTLRQTWFSALHEHYEHWSSWPTHSPLANLSVDLGFNYCLVCNCWSHYSHFGFNVAKNSGIPDGQRIWHACLGIPRWYCLFASWLFACRSEFLSLLERSSESERHASRCFLMICPSIRQNMPRKLVKWLSGGAFSDLSWKLKALTRRADPQWNTKKKLQTAALLCNYKMPQLFLMSNTRDSPAIHATARDHTAILWILSFWHRSFG